MRLLQVSVTTILAVAAASSVAIAAVLYWTGFPMTSPTITHLTVERLQ